MLPPGSESPGDPLSLGAILRILRTNWLVVVTMTTVCLFGAAAWTQLFQQPWYYAQSTIRVERPNQESDVLRPFGMDNIDRTFINNQFATIQSRTVLLPVIENLKLEQRLAKALNVRGEIDREQTYLLLTRKMLEVQDRPNTSVLDIGVWAPDRDLAAAIANEVASVYERNRIAFANATQDEALAKLREQLQMQDQVVTKQRDAVESLRRQLGLAGYDINQLDSGPELEALRTLERTLISLRVEALARKTRWEQFAAVPVEERFALVNNELVSDPNIQQLAQAYLVQQQEVERYRNQLGENHPQFASLQAKLRILREQLGTQLSGYERTLRIAFLEAESRVKAMETELTKARTAQIQVAGDQLRRFEDAVKDLRESETVLRSMRLQLRQREIELQVPKRTIELLNAATPPLRAGRPNWFLNLSVAGFLGLALGAAGALLVEMVDHTFRRVDELEGLLGVPVLGVVPRQALEITAQTFHSAEAEPYRMILANWQLLTGTEERRVVLIQSSGASEGKSSVLRNLAASAALGGERVVILDTDLRRPTQHHLLKVSRTPGLSEYLLGQADATRIVSPTGVQGLDVIPAGQGVASFTLLHRAGLQRLIDELATRYDRIFLDSPPILGVSDAALLQPLADQVVLVVQYGRLPQADVRRAARSLRDAELVGVVFNQVPNHQVGDYHYYGYSEKLTPAAPPPAGTTPTIETPQTWRE